MSERETMSCKVCGKPTLMHRTELCDACWEAQRHHPTLLAVAEERDLARADLARVTAERNNLVRMLAESMAARTVLGSAKGVGRDVADG
jgi:recombinational DNA repair protein RecR